MSPCCFFSPVAGNSFFTSSSSPVVGRLLSAIARNKIESIALRYILKTKKRRDSNESNSKKTLYSKSQRKNKNLKVSSATLLWLRDSPGQVPRVVSCLFFQLFVCLFVCFRSLICWNVVQGFPLSKCVSFNKQRSCNRWAMLSIDQKLYFSLMILHFIACGAGRIRETYSKQKHLREFV